MLIAAYLACLVVAFVTVPSTVVFLTYGLPTWLGGYLFAVLVQRAVQIRKERQR